MIINNQQYLQNMVVYSRLLFADYGLTSIKKAHFIFFKRAFTPYADLTNYNLNCENTICLITR